MREEQRHSRELRKEVDQFTEDVHSRAAFSNTFATADGKMHLLEEEKELLETQITALHEGKGLCTYYLMHIPHTISSKIICHLLFFKVITKYPIFQYQLR